MDDAEDDFTRIWAERMSLTGSVATRKKREARGMPGRRPSGRETKSAQLNIKITPTFKRRLKGFAKARGMSIAEYIEAATTKNEENGK